MERQEMKIPAFFLCMGGWVKEIIVVTSYRK